VQRPLVVAAGAFVCFGVFWGSWAVATAEVERYTGLSNAGLGLLLSASVATGGGGAALAGGALARLGPDRLLPIVLVPWGVCSMAAGIVPGRVEFVGTFALAITAAGLVDMAMNAAATVGLGGSAGGMVRFHGLFNAGTLCGAGLVAGLITGSASWRLAWLLTGAAALAIGMSAQRSKGASPVYQRQPRLGRSERGGGGSAAPSLGRSFAATAIVEGGIDTWGVLYLRTRLAATVLVGAGAYAVGQLIAATTRACGAPLMTRLGHKSGLVAGAGLAASGLLIEASSKNAALAACGLALAAGGISLCWPLTMARLAIPRSDATSSDGTTTALVGGFTASGYLGWVLGPAVVGTLSDHEGLRAGLLLLVGLAAAASATLAGIQLPSPAR
jgi:Major Facilitator Superfamily